MSDSNVNTYGNCELAGHKGPPAPAIGMYQVFDGKMPTMTRPGAMCEACVAFARQCGMTPKKVK